MSDEDKLAPLTGAGVSGNEPLVGREERQVPREQVLRDGVGGKVIAADENFVGGQLVYVTLVKLHDSGVEQVRAIVREEIRAALRETFQR